MICISIWLASRWRSLLQFFDYGFNNIRYFSSIDEIYRNSFTLV